MRTRGMVVAVIFVASLFAIGVSSASPATAHARTATIGPAPDNASAHHPDFNCDGYADTVLQGPNDDVPGVANAGDVYVLYGGPHGANTRNHHARLDALSFGVTPAPFDHFGESIAIGDYNGDGCDDLAIGAPGVTVNGHARSGAVGVLYGGQWHFKQYYSQWFTEATSGMGTHTLDNASFGWSLAAGDINDDGRTDLMIGAPGQQIGSTTNAGAVFQLWGSYSRISHSAPALPMEFDENTYGIPGNPEQGDAFGTTLVTGHFDGDRYADLAVDIFGRNVDGHGGAGAVEILPGGSFGLVALRSKLISEDSSGVPAAAAGLDHWGVTLAAADIDGDGMSELFVGNPEKQIKAAHQAGSVTMLRGAPHGVTSRGGAFFTLANTTYDQTPAENDLFGAALTPLDVDGDGHTDLAIGVPDRTSPHGASFAGEVLVLHNIGTRLSRTGEFIVSRDTPGMIGPAASNDLFGSGLYAGDFNREGRDDLAVSVPGVSVGGHFSAGLVQVFNSVSTSFATDDQVFTENRLGGVAKEADYFGWGHID